MSERSPRLALPFLMPSQAQKHVTHNEALRMLDALTQLSVKSLYATAPISPAQNGDSYIIAPEPQAEEWIEYAQNIAVYDAPGWLYFKPKPGWVALVRDQNAFALFDGEGWRLLSSTELENISSFSLGMAKSDDADFTAMLNTAIWRARPREKDGTGSFTQILEKNSAQDDVGFVLQSGLENRALLGLFGSDNPRLSVSQNGLDFRDAFVVDNKTGILSQPNSPQFIAHTNYNNYIGIDEWKKIGINQASLNEQGHFDAAQNCFIAPAAGVYRLEAHLLYAKNYTENVDISARLRRNQNQSLQGSFAFMSGPLRDQRSTLSLSCLAQLAPGDQITLEARFERADGFLAANETLFCGYKIG